MIGDHKSFNLQRDGYNYTLKSLFNVTVSVKAIIVLGLDHLNRPLGVYIYPIAAEHYLIVEENPADVEYFAVSKD